MSQASFFSSRVILAGVGLLLSLFTAACGQPAKAAEHPIVRMAIFDLDCPREQLEYTQIDDGTWGVAGCGKRTKYVRMCRQVGPGLYVHDECRWVRN